ncbi:hypothetical protein EEB13_10705 [Rhodococcus sp. WS3]|uniref:hypothetical protein n=1 Tax=Rhodococcus sp. WS3 TaxID=2486271 RepID=UPI001143CDDE|nr:hypothetical protein [Rhodococcus sp. WS3]ROZ50262.1 hypothetical protein EEB13_10705 [Rhodococcus sp. WS3]
MIIRISDLEVTVQESDDLNRMHVESDSDHTAVDTALRNSGLGHMGEENNVVLDAEALRSRCTDSTPDWERRWAAMMDYATKKGWTRDDGQGIVAHIESP